MLSRDAVVDFLRTEASVIHEGIMVYWIPVGVGRDQLRTQIQELSLDCPVIPVVLRKPLFNDPNSVLNDFMELVHDNRAAIATAFAQESCTKLACVFALLTRGELRLPQVGSPVTLPDWFPFQAGKTLDITILDITWRATSSLASPASAVTEISEALVRLEEALAQRLKVIHAHAHAKANRLTELLRKADRDFTDYRTMLQHAHDARSALKDATTFRPTLKKQAFIVTRLAAIAQTQSPASINPAALALADALLIEEGVLLKYESYFSVSSRPQQGEAGRTARFCRNLLCTVAAAYQMITAAAHASEYQPYPTLLLRGVSLDLLNSLDACVSAIEAAPEP